MLRTKSDVDQHVQTILRKVRSDHERNLRCFHIAQLYYKVQDYDKARRYVGMYLSTRDDSSSAHKLHGQAMEGLGLKEKALMAYKRSLELEANQADLVLKICELLCDKEVPFDPSKARYWSDRASALYPHSPVLFSLKEKLLGSNSDMNSTDFENLFQAELKARPNDVAVRVKLLNLYLETGRTENALTHAFEVESKQSHSNQHIWYQCVNKVCEAYYKEFPNKCSWEFYMQWLSALDRLCSLCISEILSQPTNLVEATEAVYSLDQVLHKGNQLLEKTPDMFNEFYKHLSAQLPFHIASLLLRRAKKESSMWKEIKRMVGPLMLFATNDPPNTDAAWSLSIKDAHRKLLNVWAHHAQCRVVEAGYVLVALSKESQSEKNFIEKTSLFTVNNWRDVIFQKSFRTLEGNNSSTSYFVTSCVYNEVPRKIPSKSSLKPSFFVPSFEFTYMGSLHHLVWLGLQSLTNASSPLTCKLSPVLHTTFFKSFLITVNNLNNTGVETLNQLDVDSFLYGTVFCAGMLIEDQKANGFYTPEKPHTLPPDITPLLCTAEQSKWWANACSVVKSAASLTGVKNKPSEIRQNLQRGIEVIRGEGLPLILLVSLARTFASKMTEAEGSDISKGCEERALHLWRIAVPQLERLADRQVLNTSRTMRLFDFPVKDLTPSEVTSLLEEGHFFIACHYMRTEQYEKAIETFKPLRSPLATFNQALMYQKLAEDVLGSLRGDEITSEIRSRHVVMATKARDCLYQVRNMIKADHSHPLQTKLKSKLFEIDDLLSRIEPENDFNERDGYVSEPSISFESGCSPTGDTSNHIHSHSRNKHFPSSTPLRYCDYRHRSGTADFMEMLTVHQNTNQLKIQQVLEQSRLVLDRLETIAFEQRNQRCLIEDLTNKFGKMESEMKASVSEIKKEIKRPDLYNMLDEEDYNDDMLHYPNIPFYPQRGVQGTNTVTYGAPVPPFFSPRVDQMYQSNMGFYNQGALPFPDGQQVSDILRTMPPSTAQMNPPLASHKLNAPIQNTLGQGLQASLTAAHASFQNQAMPSLQTPPKLPSQFGAPSMPNPLRPTLTSQSFGNQGPTNVVITTSDTLPTGTPPVQPTLSVTIPPQHRLGGTTTPSAPHNFQIAMPTNIKLIERSPIQMEPDYSEADDDIVEHDPLPNFKPIIPLPDEVDVKTGEENERLLFDKRAKLYRFVDKQWKDRGVGILKILKDDSTGKTRILMRRDQVHKVCANHFISSDMKLEPMTTSDKAWIWCANDFADEQVRIEKLCARFKTVEEGQLFKKVFDEAKAASASPQKNDSTKDGQSTGLDLASRLTKPSTQQASVSLQPGFSSGVLFTSLKTNIMGFDTKVDKSSKDEISSENLSQNLGGEKLKLGGSTFANLPKMKLEEKTEASRGQEEKKTESPFAGFSFNPQGTQSFLKDLLKPSSPKSILKEVQNKTPNSQKHVMFSASGSEFDASNKQGESVNTGSPFQMSGSLLFGGFQTTGNTLNSSSSSFFSAASPGSNEDEFVPTADFEPAIPLPDLVEVNSGEENEQVLFEDRAKLLRFCTETKQWKERGTGKMKILKDSNTKLVRLLMRREQVFKVCCNHRITKDIVLKPSSTSDKAVTWAARDYSEEVERNEIFTLKFKTPEQALAFREAFEKAQTELPVSPKQNEASKSLSSDQTESSKADGGFTAAKLSEKSEKKNSLSKYLPKTGSWECQGCFVINNQETVKCPACSTMKPGVTETTSETTSAVDSGVKGFSFGVKPSEKVEKKNSLSHFLPKTGSWECQGCCVINNQETVKCPACGTMKPGVTETNSEKTSSIDSGVKGFSLGFSFGVAPTNKEPLKFSFGNSPITFGALPAVGGNLAEKPILSSTVPSAPPISTSFSFGTPPVLAQTGDGNKFGFSSSKFQFTMAPTSPKSPHKTDESGSENEEVEDNGDHITFTPVVPLPEKIDVVTGEESEEVLYNHRAKLYRYDSNSKEWKERGLGDIKILKHRENGKIRLLMRREPIMKLCLNHYVTKDIEMKAKDDKSWIWHAADYSDGEVTQEKFALRFKTPEIAQEFKQAVDNAKDQDPSVDSSDSKTQQEPTKSGIVENLKTGESSKASSDDEIEVLYEKTVSEEDKQKALALKLPPNYFSYKNAPPCPGCPGCEPSDDEDAKPEVIPKEKEPPFNFTFTPQTPSIFGSSAPTFSNKTSFNFGQVTPKNSALADKINEATPAPTSFLSESSFSTPKTSNIVGQGFREESRPQNTSFFSQSLTSFSQLGTPTSNVFGTFTPPGILDTSSTRVPLLCGLRFNPQITQSIPKAPETSTSIFAHTQFGQLCSHYPQEGGSKDGVGHLTSTTPAPAPAFLDKVSDISFSSVAALAEKKAFTSTQVSDNFKWEGAGQTVFGSGESPKQSAINRSQDEKENVEEESEEDEKEEAAKEHDPQFEPVIELPPEIEMRTGEEDEEVLFSERAKLYRFNGGETKEWKERGIGNMKILKHKLYSTYRLLMRREQVHKVVCNHRITTDLEIKRMSTSEEAWCWFAMNLPQDYTEPVKEQLAVKFKNKEIAQEFKRLVQTAIDALASSKK